MTKSPQTAGKIRYLVLESRRKEPLLQQVYQIANSPRWTYLFTDTQWQAYLKESPVLLEVTHDSAEYRWALQGMKQDSLSGLILESSRGLEAVARWLRARLTVRFDGQRQGLLRFYDPWIWHQLGPKTNPQAEVIKRVTYWYGATGHERWQAIENPELMAMSPSPTLDEQQWLALNATTA